VASANASITTLNATSQAYVQLKSGLGISPGNGLSEFIWYTDLQAADNSTILLNQNKALITI